VFVLLASIQGAAVTIKVQNPSGEGAGDVLVMVQKVDDHEREIMHRLTDKQGRVPTADL
jgi:5-hydroxyisourate hydrolase-like protein (transthyretin family)